MELIPVLDLMGGQVVHAVAGRRDLYAPIETPLSDSEPGNLARAFRNLGFRQVYVADLDAIRRGEPNLEALERIASVGLDIIWDVGLRPNHELALRVAFAQRLGATVVAALETVQSAEALRQIIDSAGVDLTFSLDLQAGRPMTDDEIWSEATPFEIARLAVEAGIRQMIVLDLAQVGTGKGVSTSQLIRSIHATAADLKIISGGGVRGISDLQRLHDVGCQGVLIATAVHKGAIGPREIETVRSWTD